MNREPDLADHGPPIHPQTTLVPKPPWAAFCWTDAESLWVELPCPVGKAPMVVQYPKSESGYAKAMNLVEQCANIRKEAPPPGWFRHIESTRVVNSPKSGLAKPTTFDKKGPLPNLIEQSKQLQESLAKLMKKRGL